MINFTFLNFFRVNKDKAWQQLLVFLFFVFSIFNIQVAFGQCDYTRYDKIISGYHSSITVKTDGVYSVWGSSMKSAGNTGADQLSPQDINASNYPGLTGSVLKAALGGNAAGGNVDQAIVLTTDGLWAWGTQV